MPLLWWQWDLLTLLIPLFALPYFKWHSGCRLGNFSMASLGSWAFPSDAEGAHAASVGYADFEFSLSSYSGSASCVIYTPDTDKFLSQAAISPRADLFTVVYFSHNKTRGKEYVSSNSVRQVFCIWWGAIYNGSPLSWGPASVVILFQAERASDEEEMPCHSGAFWKHGHFLGRKPLRRATQIAEGCPDMGSLSLREAGAGGHPLLSWEAPVLLPWTLSPFPRPQAYQEHHLAPPAPCPALALTPLAESHRHLLLGMKKMHLNSSFSSLPDSTTSNISSSKLFPLLLKLVEIPNLLQWVREKGEWRLAVEAKPHIWTWAQWGLVTWWLLCLNHFFYIYWGFTNNGKIRNGFNPPTACFVHLFISCYCFIISEIKFAVRTCRVKEHNLKGRLK